MHEKASINSIRFSNTSDTIYPMAENRHFRRTQQLFHKNTTAGPQEMKNAGFFAGIFQVLLKFFNSTF